MRTRGRDKSRETEDYQISHWCKRMKTTWRNRREKSDRIEFLNGNWKIRFYESIYDLQEKFYEESYDTNGFGEIPVPGIWQNFGYDEHQYTRQYIETQGEKKH